MSEQFSLLFRNAMIFQMRKIDLSTTRNEMNV